MTTQLARNNLIPEDWALINDIEQSTSRLNSAMRAAQMRGLVVDVKLNSTPIQSVNTFEFFEWNIRVNVYARLSPRLPNHG